MSTEEFAELIVTALHEQDYFKRGTKHHPGDIAYSFTNIGESMASAFSWAISKQGEEKYLRDKNAILTPSNLKKSEQNPVSENEVGYSESKVNGYM